MTDHELLSVGVGVLNLAVVLVLGIHVRRLGLRPPLPLVVLAMVFALRAVARLVPPVGREPEGLDLAIDGALCFVLLLFLATTRRLVTTFVLERDALERSRLDYDEALFHHESHLAERMEAELDRLERAVEQLEAGDETQRRDAQATARDAILVLRGEALDTA